MMHLAISVTDGYTEFDFEAAEVSALWIEGSFELKTFQIILDDEAVIDLDWDHIDSYYYAFQSGKYPMVKKLRAGPFKHYPIVLFQKEKIIDEWNGWWDSAVDTLKRFKATKRFRLKIAGIADDMGVLTR